MTSEIEAFLKKVFVEYQEYLKIFRALFYFYSFPEYSGPQKIFSGQGYLRGRGGSIKDISRILRTFKTI